MTQDKIKEIEELVEFLPLLHHVQIDKHPLSDASIKRNIMLDRAIEALNFMKEQVEGVNSQEGKNLLPCPFCGGEAYISSDRTEVFYDVHCSRCPAHLHAGRNEEYKARSEWNTRQPSQTLKDWMER